jgi:predicted N-acetyltransferase YhbS
VTSIANGGAPIPPPEPGPAAPAPGVSVPALAEVFATILLGVALRRDAGPDGVRVRIAATPTDFAVIRDLRARYADGHLLSPDLDDADRSATLWIAEVGGAAVGTVRCYSRSAGELPVAEAIAEFAHVLPAREPWSEVARLVVAPSHRAFGVTAALADAILQDMSRTGVRGVVSVVQESVAPYYHRLGFRTRAVAPWRGIPCHLMTVDNEGYPMLSTIQALIEAARATPLPRPRPTGRPG